MGGEGFGAKIMFHLPNGMFITETVTITWGIMAFLVVGSILLTKNLQRMPSRVQVLVEMFVQTIYNLTKSTMGEDKVGFAPYMGTLILYLACANLAGLVGLRPPTADLNTTLGLALITFAMIHFNGIRKKGLFGYLKGFTEPFILLTPINLIGEVATPVSLSFRLFGNIVGGMIIMTLLYGALGAATQAVIGTSIPILAVGIPSLLNLYFDLFSGLLQTFIFAMLTMVFVAGAMD